MLKNWIYNEDMPRKSLNSTQNALGAHIANLRKSAGLTQAEVAETLTQLSPSAPQKKYNFENCLPQTGSKSILIFFKGSM